MSVSKATPFGMAELMENWTAFAAEDPAVQDIIVSDTLRSAEPTTGSRGATGPRTARPSWSPASPSRMVPPRSAHASR